MEMEEKIESTNKTNWKEVIYAVLLVFTFLMFVMIVGTCGARDNCYVTCLNRIIANPVECSNACKDVSIAPW